MKFVQKDGHGALFLNEKKVEEKQPDYIGTVTVDNIQRQISAWVKTSKSGSNYLSIIISNFQSKPKPAPKPAQATQVGVNDFETTQETFDEGYGEPQADDEEVPF